MRVAIGMHREAIEDWEATSTYAVEAERLGVDALWSAEAWAHDAVTPLAFIAAKTSRMKLGSGIMQVVGRTPALAAMTAMSLASMSGDRFVMGFGASGPQVVEGWHGVSFDKPLSRMREYIEVVRMAMRGERVRYDGEFYKLPLPGGEGKPLRSGARPREVPIYLATLGPKMLEMTGELADGWLGTSFMPEHAEVFMQHLRRGAEKAGRDFSTIDLQAGGTVQFGDDIEKMIARRRPGIAFSLGAMGSRQHNFYNMAYQRAGYEDVAKRIQALWLDGKRQEAAELVPEEMVLQTSMLGTDEMVKNRIRAYRDCGITTLRVDPVGETLQARLDTLGRVVELVRAVSKEGAPAAV